MRPEDRSAGLAAAARVCRPVLLDLAESIAASRRIDILAPPQAATVMLEIDSAAGTFSFTEVIVTTAQIRCDAQSGWGCVLGFDQAGALAAALLDACDLPAVADLVETALAAEARRREEKSRGVAATKV